MSFFEQFSLHPENQATPKIPLDFFSVRGWDRELASAYAKQRIGEGKSFTFEELALEGNATCGTYRKYQIGSTGLQVYLPVNGRNELISPEAILPHLDYKDEWENNPSYGKTPGGRRAWKEDWKSQPHLLPVQRGIPEIFRYFDPLTAGFIISDIRSIQNTPEVEASKFRGDEHKNWAISYTVTADARGIYHFSLRETVTRGSECDFLEIKISKELLSESDDSMVRSARPSVQMRHTKGNSFVDILFQSDENTPTVTSQGDATLDLDEVPRWIGNEFYTDTLERMLESARGTPDHVPHQNSLIKMLSA